MGKEIYVLYFNDVLMEEKFFSRIEGQQYVEEIFLFFLK